MSSLIPFQTRPHGPNDPSVVTGKDATIVDVASHTGRLRTTPARRRPRRDWDPAFHVDLLTF